MTNYQALAVVSAYYADVDDEQGLGEEFALYDNLKQMGTEYAQMILDDPDEWPPSVVLIAQQATA
tara:strand:+ start:97 stop:291 length:195 start_codon:yes stop_codon:yes gene_type:complete